jgi:hypothetical protein
MPKPTKPTTAIKAINLRFEPPELHQQLKRAAAASMRSLQREIIFRLTASLAAQQKAASDIAFAKSSQESAAQRP